MAQQANKMAAAVIVITYARKVRLFLILLKLPIAVKYIREKLVPPRNIKIVTTVYMYGESQSHTPACRVENPPVDTVPKAWHTLSNPPIGPAQSRRVQIIVRRMYTIHRLLAVWLMRGRILSWVIPVTSALNICIPPEELSIGSTAKVKRMIPMPPIHCIMARHRFMPWLIGARSE